MPEKKEGETELTPQAVLDETGRKMDRAIDALTRDLGTLRTGRATPSLIEGIMVDYYGVPTPLKQIASISAPDARAIMVQPWDRQSLKEIEKSIMKSEMGFNPSNDGNVITVPIPALNQERRQDMVRLLKRKLEDQRAAGRPGGTEETGARKIDFPGPEPTGPGAAAKDHRRPYQDHRSSRNRQRSGDNAGLIMQVRIASSNPLPEETSEEISEEASKEASKVPVHVAIIMDGNGRWAKKRGLPRLAGHRMGVDCIQRVLNTLGGKGVKYVTLYAFSTENWNRPPDEVEGILEIMYDALQDQTQSLHENNVHIVHIGKADKLSPALLEAVAFAQDLTRENTGVTLNVAFDYGGRNEILEAVKQVIRDQVPPEDIDEELFSKYLFTSHSPDPDLIIRTGGEMRISNFLLWQSAYSEYYHTSTLWPDLDSAELERVLEAFSNRERRFGRVNPED